MRLNKKSKKLKFIKLLVALTSVIGITIAFNNCSNAVFSTINGQNKLATPEVILGVLQDCEKARLKNQLITESQKIVLEDTAIESGRSGNICEFDKNDNLSMKNNELRARYTQTRKLNLPSKAVLCNIELDSQAQDFRYDDVFFLVFNDHLLASNDKIAVEAKLVKQALQLPVANIEIGVYEYDWKKVRTAPFQNEVQDDYCLGTADGVSSCSWPLTEQFGSIQLSFSQELLIAMSATQQEQSLQFIITGDNDPKVDCYHQRLELDATVEYFIPGAN